MVCAGGTWVFRFLRLCLYTCLLMPGFAQVRVLARLSNIAFPDCSYHSIICCACCVELTVQLRVQMFFFYFMSSRVIRSVAYGKKPRQRLDIFVPKHHWKENDVLRPVVIYVTGTDNQSLPCITWFSLLYTQITLLIHRKSAHAGHKCICLDF